MASLLAFAKKKLNAAYHGVNPLDNGQGWTSQAPLPQRPVQRPIYQGPQIQVAQVQRPQLVQNQAPPPQKFQVQVAPQIPLNVGNQTVLPNPQARTSSPVVAQQLAEAMKQLEQIKRGGPPPPVLSPQTALQVGRSFARSVPEVGATIVNKNTYTPGSRVEKALFGDVPVKSIQKKVADTYTGAKKGDHPGLALPAAIGEGLVSIVNDLPIAVSGVKAAKAAKVPEAAQAIKATQKPLNQLGAVGKDVNSPSLPRAAQETALTPDNVPIKSAGQGILLPETLSKRVSDLDKVTRSTRSIIERQGEKGRQLGGMLQGARDTKEIMLTKLQQQMPTVTKIARQDRNRLRGGGDFENFVEATQGKALPRNPRVAQAVAEWQTTHPQIRDRAVGAGLDVGDLGPKYYPHFVDYEKIFKDKNIYNQSINHLVSTGQAQTPEEAIKLLGYARDVSRNRQFGNLEASRLVDLPFYDKTPNSLINYLNGSTQRIAQTETFGAKDEQALKLIADAGKQGYDTEAMKNAYDVAVGAKQYNPTLAKTSSNIRKYITTTRLGLGALTNVSQTANTGIVAGHLRTLGSVLKQFKPKDRQFVTDTGVISDALLNDLRSAQGYESFTQKALGKGINKITAPGFQVVEKLNRSVAAVAGRDYALRLAQKGNETALRKLGVTGEIKNKTLTEAQQIQAARKMVEKTQFKVDPQDLPGWTNSPGGKLVAQFRTFSYNQGKFFSNEILKQAAKGNLLPLGRLLAVLPVGYGLYETRRRIDGRPIEEDKRKVALASFSKVGGAGLVLDLYQSINPVGSKYIPTDRRTTMAVGAVGGPAVGVAAQGVGALSEASQRKKIPEDQSQLEGKLAVKGTKDYTDLTPAARFALQQVPIIGTPIKNRVLPFKKEADAVAGMGTSKYTNRQANTLNPDRQQAWNNMTAKARANVAIHNPDLYISREQGKIQQERDAGQIAKAYKDQRVLDKVKVYKDYDKNLVDAYKMPATDFKSYVAQASADEVNTLRQLDQILLDKGLIAKSKFPKAKVVKSRSVGRAGSARGKSGSGSKSFVTTGFKTAGGNKISKPKGVKVRSVAYKAPRTRKLSVSKLPKMS